MADHSRGNQYDTWLQMETRIELHGNDGLVSRLFKQADLKTDVLSRVFRLQQESIYLEEDRNKNAEFPNETGEFNLGDLPGTKYTVHGEPISDQSQNDFSSTPAADIGAVPQPVWRSTSSSVLEAAGGSASWGAGTSPAGCGTVKQSTKSPAWSLGYRNGVTPSRLANPLSLSLSARRKQKEPSINKNISFVNLIVPFGASKSAPEIASVEANVYIKVAERAISAAEILAEAACRIPGTPLVEELILLDSKMVPVYDDHPPFDIDYWKAPSRRFYIARVEEYNSIMSNIRERRKRKTDWSSSSSIGHAESSTTVMAKEELVRKLHHAIEQVNVEVSSLRNQLQMCTSIAQMLDCKICKQIPTSPVYLTCCKQILGCKTCFETCIANTTSCPLCRNSEPDCSAITGMDSLLEALKSYSGTFLGNREDQ